MRTDSYITKQVVSAARCKENQTHETGAGAKGKRFIQVSVTWKNGGLLPQRIATLPA